MRIALPIFLLFVSTAVHASIPIGKKYGAWHVTSIWSVSGTEGNDASVILSQGEDSDKFEIDWRQGGPVAVSINIDKCNDDNQDDNDDFEAYYYAPVNRWLGLSLTEMQKRIRDDLETWLGQARLACKSPPSFDMFKVDRLNDATKDFRQRLHFFATEPRQHAKPR